MQVWGAWQDAHGRMVARHQRARARLASLRAELSRVRGDGTEATDAARRQRAVLDRIRSAAANVSSGWLGDPWPEIEPTDRRYAPGQHSPAERAYVRIGEIQAADGAGAGVTAGAGGGATAPMVVPLLGAMHLAIDTGVRDRRVAGLFQSVLTRLLAAYPTGTLRVVAFDPAGLGRVWTPFRDLIDAGAMVEYGSIEQVLAEAEAQIRQSIDEPNALRPHLLVAIGGLPADFGGAVESRLLAVAHAGIAADVTIMVAEWPRARPGGEPPPVLDTTIQLTANGKTWRAGTPGAGTAFNFPVLLDQAPTDGLIRSVCAPLARRARVESELTFAELLADPPWQESSADGLATPVGRKGRNQLVVRFDDATPHWMVGGRSGAGKTNFLLDVLAGLTSRYAPGELALYLLDFKEGVSFTEFTPTNRDPTWIPHAVAVGIESDREYGVAVLRALRTEMGRRAGEMKRAGVTKLADLRQVRSGSSFPRILTVVDEFQVLFAGNDAVARQATELLEEIARKGRSYGVHMILASQTMAGIEALYTKSESIFGQFPMRVALPGGGGVLTGLNKAAEGLRIGQAVINTEGGSAGADTLVRVPYADPTGITELRHRLWERRPRGNPAPAVFVGYAPQYLDYDPVYARLGSDVLRRSALLGRRIDVGSPTAVITLDPTPGRHLAVLGPSVVGADVLYAAAASLARQHDPGTATFLLAPLVAAADDAVAAARNALRVEGHAAEMVPLATLPGTLAGLAGFAGQTAQVPTYLFLFGADVASPTLGTVGSSLNSGIDDLRAVLRQGPVHGVHVLGWWRGLARFTADVGESAAEDVACVVALNVPQQDLQLLLKRYDLHYEPRENRALLLDRHDDTETLIVPFARRDALDGAGFDGAGFGGAGFDEAGLDEDSI